MTEAREAIAQTIKNFRLDEPLTPSGGLFQADAIALCIACIRAILDE